MNIFKHRRALIAIFAIALPYSAFAEGDVARGAELGYTCLGCHGIDGYRNAYPSFRVPRLGGQLPAYIEASLKAYRDGTRPHPTMQAQAGPMTDDDIADLVAWLASFGEAEHKATAEQVAGVQVAQICVTCHGVAGAAVQPAPPVLAGQHEDYLIYALGEYKNGSRSGNVMTAFAMNLTDTDMALLAAFYAGQDGLTSLD